MASTIDQQHGVSAAFEILLEEVEGVVAELNQRGAAAFGSEDYDSARELIVKAEQMTAMRSKIRSLRQEWDAANPTPTTEKQAVDRRNLGRLSKGLRTPDDAYRIPLLEALLELGGRAEIGKAVDLVGKKMKGVLNEYDLEPLASEPHDLRWRNTVQWCRFSLIQDGLMKSGSPRAIWEISDQGNALVASLKR